MFIYFMVMVDFEFVRRFILEIKIVFDFKYLVLDLVRRELYLVDY